MSSKVIQNPNYADYNLAEEVEKIKYFLNKENFRIDEKFLDHIEIGDIVEVYSVPGNKQIYCNDEFKKLCSYTPEQMSTIPFPTLFWREDQIHANLMKRANEITNLPKGVYSWDIERHDLVESLHPRKRTFEMNLKKIAPCFNQNTDLSVAWISTLQVEFIFEWATDIGTV